MNSNSDSTNQPGGDLEKPARDARELLKLASSDLSAAEARFNDLAFEEQFRLASAVQGDDRKELMYLKTDCTELVQAFAPQDIYLTIKQVGPDMADGLIAAANSDQIHHILDMECWHDGDLDPKQVLAWMEIFVQLDEADVQHVVRMLEPELLAGMLGRWVNHSQDPDATPDIRYASRYAVTPDSIQVDEPVVSAFLAEVFDVSDALFADVIRRILLEQELEAETEAAGLREERLAEKGFPSEADSGQIYVEVPPDELPSPPEATVHTLPAGIEGKTFFHRALEKAVEKEALSQAEADELRKEFVEVANMVMVAGHVDISDNEAVELATELASNNVSIGLEYLCAGSEEAAVEQLPDLNVQFLFRVGHTLLCRLRRRLWRELGGFDLGILRLRLDPPYSTMLDAMRRARPMIPADNRPGAVRPIWSNSELSYLENMIDEIGDIALFHTEVLPLSSAPADPLVPEMEPTYGQLSATVAASVIAGKLPQGPLTAEEVAKLALALRDEPGDAQEVAIAWLDALLGQAGWVERAMDVMRCFWREQIRAMREELAGIVETDAPPAGSLSTIQTFLVAENN